MADEPNKPANPQSQPQSQPRATQQPPRAANPAPARTAPSASASTSGNSRDIASPDDPVGPVSATRAEAIRKGREAARRSGAPRLPTAQELDRIRDEHFGGKPGTVRVDAPPAGSGPDAPPTRLLFFNADGLMVGQRDYHGPDEGE